MNIICIIHTQTNVFKKLHIEKELGKETSFMNSYQHYLDNNYQFLLNEKEKAIDEQLMENIHTVPSATVTKCLK